MIRPENIQLRPERPEDLPPQSTVLEGSIRHVTDTGALVHVTVACGADAEFLVFLGKREYHVANVGLGDRVYLAVAADDVHTLRE